MRAYQEWRKEASHEWSLIITTIRAPHKEQCGGGDWGPCLGPSGYAAAAGRASVRLPKCTGGALSGPISTRKTPVPGSMPRSKGPIAIRSTEGRTNKPRSLTRSNGARLNVPSLLLHARTKHRDATEQTLPWQPNPGSRVGTHPQAPSCARRGGGSDPHPRDKRYCKRRATKKENRKKMRTRCNPCPGSSHRTIKKMHEYNGACGDPSLGRKRRSKSRPMPGAQSRRHKLCSTRRR